MVVRATMEGGCAARSRRTGAIETGAIEDAATAIEDAHFVDFPVVFASADGGGRRMAVGGDGELVLALASVVALALVNAALKAVRGSRDSRAKSRTTTRRRARRAFRGRSSWAK